MVYIADGVSGFFLSLEACDALGVLPPGFPQVAEFNDIEQVATVGQTSQSVNKAEESGGAEEPHRGESQVFPLIACDEPHRDIPPDPPTAFPREFVEEVDLVRRHFQREEVLAEHLRTQSSLKVGDVVLVQRQAGPTSNKWEQFATVIDVDGPGQYFIQVVGSDWVSMRECQSLGEKSPVSSPSAMSAGGEGGVGEPSGGPCHTDRLKVQGSVNTVGADLFTLYGQSQLSDDTTLEDAPSSKIVSYGTGCKSYLQALLEPPSML